jgi:hypothetical protein
LLRLKISNGKNEQANFVLASGGPKWDNSRGGEGTNRRRGFGHVDAMFTLSACDG